MFLGCWVWMWLLLLAVVFVAVAVAVGGSFGEAVYVTAVCTRLR